MTRILVVDDDAVVRVAVQNLASALGWLVDLACDVEQALLASLTPDYDAPIIDLDLPDGCGDLVAGVLGLLHPRAHVVLHTGRRPPTQRGSTAYVCKDGGPLALLDHLEEVLAA